MSSDAVELDVIERGEARRSGPAVSQVTAAGEQVRGTAQPQDTSRQSTAGSRRQAVEDSNPEERKRCERIRLAHAKASDPRFEFYRVFPQERSLILDLKVEEIVRIRDRMKKLEDSAETRFNTQLDRLPRQSLHYRRWLALVTKMETKMVDYDKWWLRSKTIVESRWPREPNLKLLGHWLNSPNLQRVYASGDADEFRAMGPTRGAIQTFVNETAPQLFSLTIRYVEGKLFPERRSEVTQEKFVPERLLSHIVSAVLFLGVCIFVILPLPLMSYYNADREFRACMVSVMTFLVSLLLMAEGQNEEQQIMIVCAYGALMGNFLS